MMVSSKQEVVDCCKIDFSDPSHLASSTPPFRYVLRANGGDEVRLLRIGPSVVEVNGDSMEVDLGRENLNEEERDSWWAIVPFKGEPGDRLMDEAMEMFGINKAASNKKTKKHKKGKKPEGAPHLGVDQPFVFKRKRGRPNKSIDLKYSSNTLTRKLPKCFDSFKSLIDSTP